MRIRVYLHSGYADACPVADADLEFDTHAHADLDADTNTANTDFDVDADIEFPERQTPPWLLHASAANTNHKNDPLKGYCLLGCFSGHKMTRSENEYYHHF